MMIKKTLKTEPNLGLEYRAQRSGRLSEKQARRLFQSADTLGAPKEAKIACDAALQDAGIFGLIQHSVNLGQMPLISFMGYAALQQIQQNSLIRTLIQVPVRDMLAPGFELQVDRRNEEEDLFNGQSPDDLKTQDSETVAAIEEQWQAHKLDRLLRDALNMDGFEGGAFIFIDTGAEGPELLLPLDISEHSAELYAGRPLKFKLIDPVNVFPGNYNSAQPLADDYFVPQWWWVLGTKVHRSRLITFAANQVPLLLKPAYNFLGLPQAQLYWDYVAHWNQNRESANRLLNKFSLLAFKTSMADVLSGGLTDDLNRRIDYLAQKRSNDGVLLMDKESEDVINLNTPLSGVTDIVKQSLEWLSVISHIPAVVLFGQSPQGFNATGESDLNNYAHLIESRRRDELQEPVQLLIDILRLHYTSCREPVKVDFLPFDAGSTLQNIQAEQMKAQTAAAHIQSGITSAEEERQKLANDHSSGYQFINVEDVPEPPEEGAEEGDMGGMMEEAANGETEDPAAAPA